MMSDCMLMKLMRGHGSEDYDNVKQYANEADEGGEDYDDVKLYGVLTFLGLELAQTAKEKI